MCVALIVEQQKNVSVDEHLSHLSTQMTIMETHGQVIFFALLTAIT